MHGRNHFGSYVDSVYSHKSSGKSSLIRHNRGKYTTPKSSEHSGKSTFFDLQS